MMLRFVCLAWLLLFAPFAAAQELNAPESPRAEALNAEPEVAFDDPLVPSTGDGGAVLSVQSFGRYSIWVESETGVALRLVDKMAGPGDWAGEVGGVDGRLDVFLDRGEVLIRTLGVDPEVAPDAEPALLKVERFVSRSEAPVELVADRLIEERLADFEELGWWIRLTQREVVRLEAAGRHLADLRLWRDGSWLEGALPTSRTIEPQNGKPLNLLRLTADLPAGLYRLAAYGGPSADWTEDDGSRPFYLRSGVPEVAEAARRRVVLSPFGFDQFVVPASASYYRLELVDNGPKAGRVRLKVGPWDRSQPFSEPGDVADILKENRFPVAELHQSLEEKGQRLITVEGQAGEPVVLQHFRDARRYGFSHDGPYFVGTVHSGAPADSIEATGLLVRRKRSSSRHTVLESQSLEVRRGMTVRHRFNFQEQATLYLNVKEEGTYEIRASGDADAEVRVEPFFASGTRPAKYKRPEARIGGGEWQLDRRHYVVKLTVRRPGILSLMIRDRNPDGTPSLDQQRTERSAVFLNRVELDTAHSYTLYLNQQPKVRSGAVVRALPLDLEQALPLVADSERPKELAFEAAAPGRLVAEAEDGTFLEVSLDGTSWSDGAQADAGRYTARVRPRADQDLPVVYSLAFKPNALYDPLPRVPDSWLELPDFPLLRVGEPRRFDVERAEQKTFRMEVEEPALYRLAGYGLLGTEGILRTRVQPQLTSAKSGGEGRNFAVQMYLRPGTYQTEVGPIGQSRGRMGVQLTSSTVRDGGRLRLGTAARGWLEPGEALSYEFQVERAGLFHLRTQGLGRVFPVRLEDSGGWPLIQPGVPGDVEIFLQPGLYRWVVLPQEVRSRQWTRVERLEEETTFEGRGPFELPLGRWVEHLWLEPEDGPREGDRWRFDLPARAVVAFELSKGMEAEIWSSDRKIAEITRHQRLQKTLEKGGHELRVRPKRVDNRVSYGFKVEPFQLLAGTTRTVNVPTQLSVAVGEAGLVELSSLGAVDVRARLFDNEGRLLAVADDRPGDWNFRLSRRLQPGLYRLGIEPVSGEGQIQVAMSRPEESTSAPWQLAPGEVNGETVYPGDGVARVPLILPAGADVVVVTARSAENIRLIVESADGGREAGARQGLDVALVVPLPPGLSADRNWTVRVESLDQSGNATQLQAVALTAPRFSEVGAVEGLRPERIDGLNRDLGVLAIDLQGPGCFRQGQRATAEVGAGDGRALESSATLVSTDGDVFWMAAPAGRPLKLRRLWLEAGAEAERLATSGASTFAVCDVAPTDGRAWVLAEPLSGSVALADGSSTFDGFAIDGRRSIRAVTAGKIWVRSTEAGPSEVDLRVIAVQPSEPQNAPWGESSWTLEPGGSVNLDLPAGSKQLALGLSRGTVAVVDEGNPGSQAFWARGQNRQVTSTSGAGRLSLQDVGGEGGLVTLVALPTERVASLAWGRPHESPSGRAGTLSLAVEPADRPTVLRVFGGRNAVLKTSDGTLRSGLEIPLERGVGGRLDIEHDPGWVAAVLDAPSEDPSALGRAYGFDDQATAEPLSPPQVPSSGGATTSRWAIDMAESGVLHLRIAEPVASRLVLPDGRELAGIHPEGLELDLPVAGGTVDLSLRGLAGRPWSGPLEVFTGEVTEIGEGLGPEALLGTGESRFYSFEIGDVVGEAGQDVGFGAFAETGEVEGRLIDPSGRVLGQGAVMKHRLQPGRYLFVLTLPPEAPPVIVRPALAGLVAPSTGPPKEVVEQYLRPAGGAP